MTKPLTASDVEEALRLGGLYIGRQKHRTRLKGKASTTILAEMLNKLSDPKEVERERERNRVEDADGTLSTVQSEGKPPEGSDPKLERKLSNKTLYLRDAKSINRRRH